MKNILNDIIRTFKENEDASKRAGMIDYMRGQFDFFGVTSPIRKEISRPYLKNLPKEKREDVYALIELLWQQPQRELHYLAQELFFKIAKKTIQKEDIAFIESLLIRNSWWDTIDFIAPKIVKIYFEKFPDERNAKVDDWIASENIWLQRSALLFQLKQKEKIDIDYMFFTIKRLAGGQEFFINKAIGWLLREYAKKQPEIILDFVKKEKDNLANLSIREALKHYPFEREKLLL